MSSVPTDEQASGANLVVASVQDNVKDAPTTDTAPAKPGPTPVSPINGNIVLTIANSEKKEKPKETENNNTVNDSSNIILATPAENAATKTIPNIVVSSSAENAKALNVSKDIKDVPTKSEQNQSVPAQSARVVIPSVPGPSVPGPSVPGPSRSIAVAGPSLPRNPAEKSNNDLAAISSVSPPRSSGISSKRPKSKRPGHLPDRSAFRGIPVSDGDDDGVVQVHANADGGLGDLPEEEEEDVKEEDTDDDYSYDNLTQEERDRTIAWFEALENKDDKGMLWFVESGFDVNRPNQNGWSALHISCFDGLTPIVQILLNAQADINQKNVHDQTALILAVKSGHFDIIDLLLTTGECDVNAAMGSGTTALHNACQNGDYHTVKKLLQHGASVLITRTSEGYAGITPLHDSCTVGDCDSVEILLDSGANIDAQMGNYFTPLHNAAKCGYARVVKELLNRGADYRGIGLDIRGGNVHAVHLAAEYNQPDALDALLKGGADGDSGRIYHGRAGVTPLHIASIRNNVDIANVIIRHGCDGDARDEDGVAAIHHATRNGFKEITEMLIKAGCDINVGACSAQSGYQTPLHFAVRFKHLGIVKLLITAGAQVEVAEQMRYETTTGHEEEEDSEDDSEKVETTLDGYTALHWAAENGDLPMVRLLLASNCPVNAPASFETNHGVTPLHLASQDGHTEIVTELLKYDHCYRDPLKNTADRTHITPLHQAAYNGHLDTVQALIQNRAKVTCITDNGYTPLHYAAQQGQTDIAKVLIDAGVDVDAVATLKNQSNITALHLAVQSGCNPMVKVLIESGVNVNIGKSMGDITNITPLHHAVHKQNSEAVDMLLKAGCSVDVVTSSGHSPLHMACERGGKGIAFMLISKQANVNQTYSYKENTNVTPLHVAAQHGFGDIVRLLVPAGADVNSVREYEDRSQMTALHLASENGFLDAVRALLELGAVVDVQDSLGFTPLHLSVQYSFHEVTRALIAAECSIKKETISGLTPVRLAEQLNDHQALLILKDAKRERRNSMKRSFMGKPRVTIKKRETKSAGSSKGIRGLLCGFNKNH